MRQINFGLIFSFGLITVFFTLANTNPTTVHVLPGVEYTLPLAGLLLLAAGLGAVSAWFFAAWTGMLNNVEQFSKANDCLLYTSPSPRDLSTSRMPSSA